ncbi:hypothetical protein Riv7116_0884 [Rivularia sp. PCC 7116]|uniref:hypothetical protein n=1 Tax=Rivularia sp. PCC 7116 TaxID=373994 RepID=UPI00029F076B|nr:hypothetical protein [Rivularia sp. PCC 7116]AFY53463.1 hypothetical protein Riv7116_0884 [Rivularia sp. PCC 7116]
MKFISGLFSGKKDGNFFLELKDEPDEPMAKANSKSVEAPASNNGRSSATTAKTDTVKVKDAENEVKEVASDKVQEVDVEMVQTAKGVEAKVVPVEKKEAKKKAAKKAVSDAVSPEDDKETLFAPKYLIPKNDNVRRRPGANMNSFLDMASKVKAPSK